MEPNIIAAESLIHPAVLSGAENEIVAGERIIRREFLPPFCNPPISNYRKFWASSTTAFWSAFGVRPSDGSTVNQLGTKPVTCAHTAFQEVGFGYTFKAALTTDYWFEAEICAGPTTCNGSKNTIELELLGARVPKTVIPVTSRYLTTRAYLDAQLTAGVQYTLLFKSRVEITVNPGETKYGEVINRFPRLVVSYLRSWGIEPAGAESLQSESVQSESIDLGHALESLRAGAEGGEVLLQPVSYEEIARAGADGFGGFSGGE
jgi:hypothetical protein